MNTTLQLLAGDEDQFKKGLVELGWFDYAPTLTNEPLLAAARRSLNPRLRSAGEVAGAGASVYRLTLDSHRWQDGVKVVESQLNRRPHFAVVFVTLPRAVMIVVPEDPDKARTKKPGIRTAQIFLDTTRDDKHADEVIKRLKAAKREGFRKRLQDSADIKRVTDGFYKAFDKQKDAFISFIEDVGSLENKQWYASVLLNRLMFLYFIQSNGLLAPGYLRSHLEHFINTSAANTVHSTNTARSANTSTANTVQLTPNYYRDFLCPLFFEGLAVERSKRSPTISALLGDVPYLNGGLFMPHKLENEHPKIAIADEAFYGLFKLFDEYTWYIDDRPIARDRELNPDVLGYIFEKYVNQKQMGAYYTKEDITGYICRNTIIPRLFDMLAEARGLPEFRLPINEIEPYIWEAVKHGVVEPLPDYIEPGVKDVSQRTRWNEAAPATHALPTETWRELIARRQRYSAIHNDFAAGKITTSNDFITYNLDLPGVGLDFVHQCTDASILSDLYFKCLQRITVLDPTCGSGAFLFAALNILYPLYEACLDRMEELKSADRVEDRPLLTMKGEFEFANEVDAQQTFMDPDFDPYTVTTAILERCQAELDRIADQRHPNRSYYIHKTIIVNNLYGVDIMEEAVEICKLRLFLNLISHADPDAAKENLGIEPLPDIDFNILAGNTLVGYVNKEHRDLLWASAGFDFDSDPDMDTRVRIYSDMLADFRNAQLQIPALHDVTKHELLRAAGIIRDGENPDAPNNRSLNSDVWKLHKSTEQEHYKGTRGSFLSTHRPLHWFVEFPQVMATGGFDVIIGNPPYVEYSRLPSKYGILNLATRRCDNLWAFIMERAKQILNHRGRISMIVPLSLTSADRMITALQLIAGAGSHTSILSLSGDAHPCVLFDGVKMSFTIFTHSQAESESPEIVASKLYRWLADARQNLFQTVEMCGSNKSRPLGLMPKLGSESAVSVLNKLTAKRRTIGHACLNSSDHKLLYHRIVRHFVKCLRTEPYFWNERDGHKRSSDYKELHFDTAANAELSRALIVSSTFYLYFLALSDSYHCGRDLLLAFPADLQQFGSENIELLCRLGREHEAHLKANSVRRRIEYKATGWIEYDEFYPRLSKHIVDEIDCVLAPYYGFTDDELDFIINYDIKYRMGKGVEEGVDKQ